MKIQNITIKTPVALAPMEAVNCKAFRMLCKYYGAGLIYTAMIDVDDFLDKLHMSKKEAIDFFLDIDDIEEPLAVQLTGKDPKKLERVAKIIEPYADIIDINFGCIEGDVLGKKQGAYFIKHPEMIERTVMPLMKSVKKPVTAKIRTGWDEKSINVVEVSVLLEKLGFKAIAIHGRTKKQGYRGKADWELIKKAKQKVRIPIIGNGDITKAGQAKYYIERDYCDAVMVGRYAKINPFIFTQIKQSINNKRVKEYTENEFERTRDLFSRFYDTQKYRRDGEKSDHLKWLKKGYNLELKNKK